MGSVAGRASEARVNVVKVLLEAGVLHDLVGQIMALAAKSVRAVHAQIGAWEKIGDELAGRRSLAEFMATFQDVCPLGAMRPVRPGSSEFAIVVTIVAVTAENAIPHQPALGGAI